MNKIVYRGYRFPPEIIQRAVWLYYRCPYRELDPNVSMVQAADQRLGKDPAIALD